MATSTQLFIPFTPSPPSSAGGLTPLRMSDPKERFFRHFQAEVTIIQDQIDNLATMSPVGGERRDGTDTVLCSVSRLSKEVMDASDYIPSHDQRAYSQAIKALTDRLNEMSAKFAPKSRFQFKPRAAKSATTSPTTPVRDSCLRFAQSATTSPTSVRDARVRFSLPDDDSNKPDQSSASATETETRDAIGTLPSFSKNYNEELARPNQHVGIRKPSFSTAKNISILDQTGLHIMLPATASRATSSGSLTNLTRCIVDMTIPTSGGAPFAGLALKDIKKSLIIAGHVAGPAHITGLEDSIVLVAARQVRMHECKNVDVYLHCSSHPIIEDCSGMRFAQLPEPYATNAKTTEKNQWNQVDDFKWLKSEPSPNWSVMPEGKQIPEHAWKIIVSGDPRLSTGDILRKAGVLGA
ncbi:Uu.00g145940.m01.CDS01 [Anthostomella pinea]|uniref:Uu.00g145940.m01.CDS01 n=1 Tax=Anthostomella pinea TaxID=933095 RepID=A0AAI8VS13_9PEZI|nr:Uu.00g145940.m01.CDS01 [Anthostomella pinea]